MNGKTFLKKQEDIDFVKVRKKYYWSSFLSVIIMQTERKNSGPVFWPLKVTHKLQGQPRPCRNYQLEYSFWVSQNNLSLALKWAFNSKAVVMHHNSVSKISPFSPDFVVISACQLALLGSQIKQPFPCFY
jgi:hypothetical protein